jgi:hypothetical protein
MRYWVFLNNAVSDRPYAQEELEVLPEFTPQTLIQPESAPQGQTPQWVAASSLLKLKKQSSAEYVDEDIREVVTNPLGTTSKKAAETEIVPLDGADDDLERKSVDDFLENTLKISLQSAQKTANPAPRPAPTEAKIIDLKAQASASNSSSQAGEGREKSILEAFAADKDVSPKPAPSYGAQDIFADISSSNGIEEISLDQPTAVISDFLPNVVAPQKDVKANKGDIVDLISKKSAAPDQQTGDLRSVQRIKPAAIKTVPMVPSSYPETDAYAEPQAAGVGVPAGENRAIEEREEGNSIFFRFAKSFSVFVLFLFILLAVVWLLAKMQIVPEKFSPVHIVLGMTNGENNESSAQSSQSEPQIQLPALETPASAAPEENVSQIVLPSLPQEVLSPASEQNVEAEGIVAKVKNYLLPTGGATVMDKLLALYPTQADRIKWTAEASVDTNMYSVAAKLPADDTGYSLTYRFNYDNTRGELVPTTAEANNLFL